jgi:uncharacterized SAM-binding protein YcdF (DUF218 family)
MKQCFAPLLDPLGAIWLLMALSVLVLLLRREWRSALWLMLPTVLLFLVGSTPLAELLVGAAERPYGQGSEDRGQRAEADAAIALGGTQRSSAYDVYGFSIGPSEERILAVAELVRLGKAKTLVLGGSTQSIPGKPGVPTMSLVQNWLAASGLATARVTHLGICANTHDEALQFRKLKEAEGWQKVLLVTSALHMRRAEAVFRKQGVDVTPVACDFQVYGVPRTSGFPSPFPSQHRLELLSLYLHEQIGWWVYRWRGWV